MNCFIERTFCPACKSNNFIKLYSAPFLEKPIYKFLDRKFSNKNILDNFKDARYSLQECKECNLIFQKYILNDFFMTKLYDEWLNLFDNEMESNEIMINKNIFELNTSTFYAQEIMKVILYLKKRPSDINVLDFGMGYGKWVLMAKAFGCNAYGTDLSDKRVDLVKSLGINVINLNELRNYKFDFINSEQVFEHLPNPKETLTLLKNSLKTGGILKISVPDGRGIKKRLKFMDWGAKRSSNSFLLPITPLIHINCFNYKNLINMVTKSDFKHINIPYKFEYTCMLSYSNKAFLKNILRPVYNRLMRKTYLFFKKQ